MRSVIVSARTREEAIEKALRELGVERHEVHVEILEEGSRGFFGLGAKDVKIRVIAEHLPDDSPEPSAEARRDTAGSTPRPSRSRDRSRQGAGRRRQRDQRGRKDAPAQQPSAVSRNVSDDTESDSDSGDEELEPVAEEKAEPRVTESEKTPIECDRARALLEEMIHLMGVQATVQANPMENGDLQLVVESEDSSLLIGRKGKTLQALQYLINRMVHSGENSDAPDRILVDIAGYVDRRKAALEDMAKRLARRAKESGKTIRVKPMSPQERRIIHVTLQDDPDVKTYSVGEAGSRCVVIAPREERQSSRRPSGGRRQQRGRGRRPQNGRNTARPPRNTAIREEQGSSVTASNEVSYQDDRSEVQ